MNRPIRPFIFRIYRPWHQFIFIKIRPDNVPQTMKHIEHVFNKHAGRYPFRYEFLDSAYNRLYGSVTNLNQLLAAFSLLSIIVACLGLFGLSSFSAVQRRKEIGIRKVLGASVTGITLESSKEFFKWIVLANIIAWPVAFLFIQGWLDNFVYRAPVRVDVFAACLGLTLSISLLTTVFQALKAALADPAQVLRHE